MAVQDLWVKRDGTRSARYGRGKRWRVSHPIFTTKAFDDRREADLYWAECLREAKRAPRPVVTVGGLLDLWLDGKRGLSKRGRTACAGDARHLRAQWGSRNAADLTSHEVQAWIAGLTVERGPRAARVRRPASEALRRRLVQALHAALTIGVETGALDSNPIDRVRVPRDHKREPRYLSIEEVTQLATAAGGVFAALIWLLATTGLRIGEAVALRIADVDVARRRVRVIRAKSGRGRDVPVPAKVLSMLDLSRRPSDLVFVGALGGAIHPDSFRFRQWRSAVQSAGLDGLRIHDLRHTAASLAISSGADVKSVQAMLGHASATMTLDLYGHLLDGRLDEVGERMDAMLPIP